MELNEIRCSMPPLVQSRLNEADHVRWTLTSNGQFSIASLWDKLRTFVPRVMWHKLAWFSGHILKCSIVTWIAIQNRLSTADRLVLFGLNISPQCSLCPGGESHDHLLFNCPFSQQVWGAIQTKLHVSWPPRSWDDWVTLLSDVKGKSRRTLITKLVFTIVVYYIWIERNVRKFQNLSCTWEVVFRKFALWLGPDFYHFTVVIGSSTRLDLGVLQFLLIP
ncbi:uncharacterized protein LOC131309492 [Rhododendron vialii]|uniref:uncharacterized protein LOC131309492 n=1 Tax=Rhododendron vialii TaxID=182163 RepID=UPI00265E705F|nr:uncharacterized protein LOC131309492 [Rhododendron vialii]